MEFVRLEVPGTRTTVRSRRPTADRARVAIGTFDGVHLGHRQVLAGCDTVLTFHPHPMQVLAPHRVPKLLSDRKLKLQKLDALGIRRVAIIPFDLAWAMVPAQEFVEKVVVKALSAASVSVGMGFRFGADGAGTTSTFSDMPGLSTRVVPLVSDGKAGEPISSTRIRGLVLDGNVELAGELLGTPLTLPALVGEGGRLSIPAEFVRPAPGTYSGYLDNEPCSLRVSRDLTIGVSDRVRTGARVRVAFVRRGAR